MLEFRTFILSLKQYSFSFTLFKSNAKKILSITDVTHDVLFSIKDKRELKIIKIKITFLKTIIDF